MTDPHFYTAGELAELDKDALATIADARGLEVEGTGTDGNVLVDDLREAILDHQDRTGINPALEPAPEESAPVEKTYKVIGALPVHDTESGKTFKAALPLQQEALLLEGGHIQVVAAKPGQKTKE